MPERNIQRLADTPTNESFFDNLARTLASPMPRRRAVRVLGAAVVVATLPGLRPRSALARSSKECNPATEEIYSKVHFSWGYSSQTLR